MDQTDIDTDSPLYQQHYVPLNDTVKKIRTSISQSNYKETLYFTKQMLLHLTPKNNCPETPTQYEQLYSSILEQMQYIHNSFFDHPNLVYLYNSAYQCKHVLPRLYLLITIGSALIQTQPQHNAAVIRELFISVKSVNHPIRGLFIRSCLITFTKNLLPDTNSPHENGLIKYEDTLVYLMSTIEDMVKLWSEISDNKNERKETQHVIVEAFNELGSLRGTNGAVFEKEIVPKIVQMILNKEDASCTELLMDCLVSSFREECVVKGTNAIVKMGMKVKNTIKVQTILIKLFDRLEKFFNNKENVNVIIENNLYECMRKSLFQFKNMDYELVWADLSTVTFTDKQLLQLLEFEYAYMKLVYAKDIITDNKIKYDTVVKIFTSSQIIASKCNRIKNTKQIVKLIFNLLSITLDNNISVFKLESYETLSQCLDTGAKYLFTLKIAEFLSNRKNESQEDIVNTTDKLKQIEKLLVPVLYEDITSQNDVPYEMNTITKFVYKLQNTNMKVLYEMYEYLYEVFVKGGEMRYKYTLSALVNIVLRFCYEIYTDKYDDKENKKETLDDNIKLISTMMNVLEKEYVGKSVQMYLMIYKQLKYMEFDYNKRKEFLNKAVDLYAKAVQEKKIPFKEMKSAFGNIVGIIGSNVNEKEEHNEVLSKCREFVLNIVDGYEKVFHMNTFICLLIYDNDYVNKINEWILRMKDIIKQNGYKDIQSFWIVNDVINKCIWFNNKDTNKLIPKEIIKDLVNIMGDIISKQGVSPSDTTANSTKQQRNTTIINTALVVTPTPLDIYNNLKSACST